MKFVVYFITSWNRVQVLNVAFNCRFQELNPFVLLKRT